MNPRSIHVLLIDDEPDDANLIAAFLDRIPSLAVTTTCAPSAHAALHEIQFVQPDLVILDHNMPGVDGVELIGQLREHTGAPIILISNHGDERLAVRALNAGAMDYLPKSVLSATSLERSLSNALQKAELTYDLERSNAELRRANEDLRKRNGQVESFHHILSHELRTPLTAVREFVSLVLEGVAGDINDDQARYLEIACESCDQMRMLLDDILDATRLDTGKLRIDPSPHSLAPVVARVLAGMESRAEEAGVILRNFVGPSGLQVRVDESRVAQVIGNLVSNAIKFTPPGGTVEVHEHGIDGNGRLVVEVRDEGCGIPPEHAEHIFERLYQVPSKDQREHGGLGLGLAICKQIVELHGGDMRVESEPGRGSSFYFSLPICSPSAKVSH